MSAVRCSVSAHNLHAEWRWTSVNELRERIRVRRRNGQRVTLVPYMSGRDMRSWLVVFAGADCEDGVWCVRVTRVKEAA